MQLEKVGELSLDYLPDYITDFLKAIGYIEIQVQEDRLEFYWPDDIKIPLLEAQYLDKVQGEVLPIILDKLQEYENMFAILRKHCRK